MAERNTHFDEQAAIEAFIQEKKLRGEEITKGPTVDVVSDSLARSFTISPAPASPTPPVQKRYEPYREPPQKKDEPKTHYKTAAADEKFDRSIPVFLDIHRQNGGQRPSWKVMAQKLHEAGITGENSKSLPMSTVRRMHARYEDFIAGPSGRTDKPAPVRAKGPAC